MKFGILWNLPSLGVLTTHGFEPTGTFEEKINAFITGAKEAERLGYDSLFVSDHAFMSCTHGHFSPTSQRKLPASD